MNTVPHQDSPETSELISMSQPAEESITVLIVADKSSSFLGKKTAR